MSRKHKHPPGGPGSIQRDLQEIKSEEGKILSKEAKILDRDGLILLHLHRIESKLDQLLEETEEIEDDVHPQSHQILTKGRMILMPASIQVGGVAHAKLDLKDQNGAPMTIDSTYQVAYVASNPASVSVAAPAADGNADITGVAADTGNSISAVVTRPDGVQITLTPDTLVVEGAPPPPTQVLTSGAVQLST